MTTYEIVQDYDDVEHVVLRPGAAWEHVPVCQSIAGEMGFDGPSIVDMCEDCLRWLAVNGDPALLAAAVAGARARWLSSLPGASPLADPVLASKAADAETATRTGALASPPQPA